MAKPVVDRALAFALPVGMGVPVLTVFALTALSPILVGELALKPAQVGLLAALSSAAAFAGTLLVRGFVDIAGCRLQMCTICLISGLSLFVFSRSHTATAILAAVVASGLAQSISNPATNRLIATHVGPSNRGAYLGWKQSGVQMAQLVAGLTLPLAAALGHWRLGVGLLAGLALAATWFMLKHLPGRQARPGVGGAAPMTAGRRGNVGAARKPAKAQVLTLALYLWLMALALQATGVYLPLFAYESVGLAASISGSITGLVGVLGVVSRIVWAQSIARRFGFAPAAVTLSCISAAGAAMLVAAAAVGDRILLWAGVATHGLASVASVPVVMVAVLAISTRGEVGRASAAVAGAMYLGFAQGPASIGWIVGHAGYGGAWMLITALYVAAALVAAVAWWRWWRTAARLAA